jgi:hypothetical protein
MNIHDPRLGREIRAGRFCRTPTGILLPRLCVEIQGVVTMHGRREYNLVTNQGLALIAADAWPANLYIAIFTNNVTPVAGWTGATWGAIAGEITSTTDGYIEADRPELLVVAEFNMRSTGAPIPVYGFGVCDSDVRGSVADNLVAAKLFTEGVEQLDNRDILVITYAIAASPVPE